MRFAAARYSVAIASVIFGWLARAALTPAVGATAVPFISFFPAVAMATWYGGLGPGVLTVVLSAAVANWFFIEPVHSWTIATFGDIAALGAFAISCGFIVGAIAPRHRGQAKATAQSRARADDPVWLWPTIAVLTAAVFAADAMTPTGIEVWSFFILTVVLCKLLTWRPLAPLGVAVVAGALVIAGHFLQESTGPNTRVMQVNRGLGVAALLLLGLIGRQFVLQRIKVRTEDWLKAGQIGLSQRIAGEQPLADLGTKILSFVGAYVGAQVGALYATNGAGSFARCAGFAAVWNPRRRRPRLRAGRRADRPGRG